MSVSHNYFIVYRRPKNRKYLSAILKKKKQKDIISSIKKERGTLYWDRFKRARSEDSKARIIAEEMTGSDHVKVTRKRIPPLLKKQVEHDLKANLTLKPKLYVFEPKKGHSFKKKRKIYTELGITYMPVIVSNDDELGEIHTPHDPYILLPKSHYKDRTIADIITLHELAETLALQEIYKQPSSHARAVEVEKRLEKKHGLTRQQMLERAEKLYKNPENWQ